MPKSFEHYDNADRALRGPGGYIFPPFIAMERGESLNEFAARAAHDPITIFQALVHVIKRVETMHSTGLVHRDLKPANILRDPQMHSWLLMDFGCAAHDGALADASADNSIAATMRVDAPTYMAQSSTQRPYRHRYQQHT